MKKITAMILLILTLISIASCKNAQEPIANETTAVTTQKSTVKEVAATTVAQTEAQLTTAAATSATTAKTETTTEEFEIPCGGVVPAAYLSLNDIREIEAIAKSNNNEKLREYIFNNPNIVTYGGLYPCEEALKALDMIKSTTVVLLDGNIKNFSEIFYLPESGYIMQDITLAEQTEISVSCYPPNTVNIENKTYENKWDTEYLKEISRFGVTAKIYKYTDSNVFLAETYQNGTLIKFRIGSEYDLDYFEKNFSRLRFYTVDDLMNKKIFKLQEQYNQK